MKHTPTPWKVNLARSNDFLLTITTADETGNVALVHRAPSDATANANSAFIVQAVNAHADLLQALKAMSDSFGHYCEGDPSQDEIDALALARAAIAKTQGDDDTVEIPMQGRTLAERIASREFEAQAD